MRSGDFGGNGTISAFLLWHATTVTDLYESYEVVQLSQKVKFQIIISGYRWKISIVLWLESIDRCASIYQDFLENYNVIPCYVYLNKEDGTKDLQIVKIM